MGRLTVIGIGGKAQAGKDTTRKILEALYGYQRIAMGDGPRAALRDLDGPDMDFTKELEATGRNNRWSTQVVGTDAREDLPTEGARNLWIDYALVKLRYAAFHHTKKRERFCITGIRFQAEAALIASTVRLWGGHYEGWNIVRDGSGLNGDLGRHKSEHSAGGIYWTKTLVNDSTIADLAQVVSVALDAPG